ncbi:phytanoyl-CoA dioxygenase family protein [Pseudonocardia nigra]|uniref:phytanoyl-CoA dioxygenase family protein n=1 Tax=Pseudonocardia nigra TaxID=1921578 RepID=UPI001C5F84E7|nr:phytanoyl-CoA dioxygenase family protein [Pseudonocardia nigra]
MTTTRPRSRIDLEDLRAVLTDRTDLADHPHAETVVDEVLVYDAAHLLAADRREVQQELVRAFTHGPGVVVLRGVFPDRAVVDRTTRAFEDLIAEQRASGATAGDHFAAPGANDRVWNALEKLAVRAPEVFVEYYANDVLALVATAWLGPGYQVTSQVNVVNPGGTAQVGHRDYHLGFLAPEVIEQYPAHVQRLSPVLTLQGAVAHSDMPVESGPTLYLPHSQKYEPGYRAMHRPEFQEYFERHHVQLPLEVGDAAFFNPAVMHAAGHNRSTDIRRMANLLQISSAFGRAMESVDRERMCLALYPALREHPDAAGTANAVAAAAEGYPFPTNLDRDPPVDGLAPPSQADVLRRALAEGWEPAALTTALAEHAARRRTA